MTVSVILLYLTAGTVFVRGFLAIPVYLAINEVPIPDHATADATAATQVISLVASLVGAVLLGVGFAVLAVFVGRGNHPARVVTWSLGGVVVLGCSCGLVASAFSSAILSELPQQEGAPSAQEMLDATPAWTNIANFVLSLVIILALVAVVILLALPASNDYFRKEQEVWVPPSFPGDSTGGYPPVPPGVGYPPVPPGPSGYPPAGAPPASPDLPTPPTPPTPPVL